MSTTFVFGQLKQYKFIAALVVVSMIAWAAGIPGWNLHAQAAALTSISDTLSDSDVSVRSNHTIAFTTPNGILAGQTISINFPVGFDLTGVWFTDIDIGSTTVEFTLGATPSGAAWGVATSGPQDLVFTNGNTDVASGTPIVIKIGTNTVTGGVGTHQILNPTAGSYEIAIGGNMPSSGNTRVVIIDDVVVTAAVSTSFTFTIAGVAIGQLVNGGATTTATTTTATAIPFGILTPGISKINAQDLSVSTNARNGFVVTVIQDQNLTSSSGADIDTFKNGSSTATPTAWTAPTNVLGVEDTYGHMGFTSDDSDLGAGDNDFGTDLWAGNLSTTTPRQIFSNSGPSDGVTQDIGIARIGYRIQITSLQEAGNDYTNSLTYVATPTF